MIEILILFRPNIKYKKTIKKYINKTLLIVQRINVCVLYVTQQNQLNNFITIFADETINTNKN